MKRILITIRFYLIYIITVLLALVSHLKAADYIVTSETSKIYCSNGNMVIMKPFQVLELTEEVDRETFQVRLPSKFAKTCPEGQVSSIAVYNLRNLAPKSKTSGPLQKRIIRKSPISNPFIDLKSDASSFHNPEASDSDNPDLYAITRPHFIQKHKSNNFRRPKITIENPEDTKSEDTSPEDASPEDASPEDASPEDASPEDANHEAIDDDSMDHDPNYSPLNEKFVLGSSRSANDFFKKITKHLNPLCREKFLGSDGFGPWGDHAKDVLNRAFFEKTLLLNHTAYNNICPAWAHGMNLEQKKNLIVLTILGASNWESSCDQSVRVKCPNGICAGILQLDFGKEKNYITYSKLKEFCPNYVSKSAEGSISCSLGMFIQDLWQGEKIVGNNKSYWEVFAPKFKNDRIQEFKNLIGQIPDCQISSSELGGRLVRNTSKSENPYQQVDQLKNNRSIPIRVRNVEQTTSLTKGTI